MPSYQPPIRDIQFVLFELLDYKKSFHDISNFKDLDFETVNQIIEEAGKFSSKVVQPLNQIGDKDGCVRADDGSVTTPKGFKEAYKEYIAMGWPALACDPIYGGQGLPHLLNTVLYEMLNAANQSWTMYAGLSHGAYECLQAHGRSDQKNLYLNKLVSGEWTGTMCLTEPHCGTDLGMLKTKATPREDGLYSITGTKIFISSGEHDLSENIVHLVLARLPDAPKGTKGISLFVVPKLIPNKLGEVSPTQGRNNLSCGALENKMGIHGNATCVMNFDGAVGDLVGEPNKGLSAMFVMMNSARVGVALQSLGLSEVAYQNSLAYAKERRQMRSLTGKKDPEMEADSIIVHPDVRRMLLTQRAYTEGARAFAYWVTLMIDVELNHQDADTRKKNADMIALFTPIIKSFVTDNAFLSINEGLQIFGGHGYIAEWGMEQFVRDARINMIYEGTNAIQSLDLLGRKVLSDAGAKLRLFGQYIKDFIDQEGFHKEMLEFIDPLEDLTAKVEKLTLEIGSKSLLNPDEVGAAAVPYTRTLGHLIYAYLFARMARIALNNEKSEETFYKAKLATARFYYKKLLPETNYLIEIARAGASSLMALDADLF